MEITQWYAVSLGALAALYLIYRLLLIALSAVRVSGAYFILKYLVYPQIPKLLRGEGTITWFHCLLILLYIFGNVMCLALGVASPAALGSRSGLMSLINLIPLYASAGGCINALAGFCGLLHENCSRAHRWIGRVAISQSLMHTVISLTKTKPKPGLPGLVAAGGMSLLLIFSLLFIRRLFYETFLKIHLLLAIATVVALWYHVISKTVKIYLTIGFSVLGTALAFRIFLIFYRNFSDGAFSGRVQIQQLSGDAIQVSLKLQRPWEFKAGQYINLCVPGVSFWGWLQYHPFMVTWWHKDGNGVMTAILLIQPHKGFTRNLQKYQGSSLRALIDGPYESGKDLGSYGNVVLFTTGIGIAGQLPYIKSLLEGHKNREVRTGRISLFWQVGNECDEDRVREWMDELLGLDNHYILNISLYVLGEYYSKGIATGNPVHIGFHKRIKKFRGVFDINTLIRCELEEQKGRIVVAACTDSSTKDKIRETVRGMLRENVRFEELHFYPSSGKPPAVVPSLD